MTRGILGYGVHVPHYRLQRSAIGTTLGAGGGTGTRAVASYDEDATSMSVEAARVALRSFDAPTPAAVYFSSVTPPYLDKTNANAIHAALNYPSEVFAGDMVGSARSTTAALTAALNDRRPVLVTSSDVRTGRPGSGDEASLGDAAAAVMIGSDDDAPVIAEWIGTSDFMLGAGIAIVGAWATGTVVALVISELAELFRAARARRAAEAVIAEALEAGIGADDEMPND